MSKDFCSTNVQPGGYFLSGTDATKCSSSLHVQSLCCVPHCQHTIELTSRDWVKLKNVHMLLKKKLFCDSSCTEITVGSKKSSTWRNLISTCRAQTSERDRGSWHMMFSTKILDCISAWHSANDTHHKDNQIFEIRQSHQVCFKFAAKLVSGLDYATYHY